MKRTPIEWTDWSWNVVYGCTPISKGCSDCYAHKIALDCQKKGIPAFKNGFDIRINHKKTKDPLNHKPNSTNFKRETVFVNSMSDFFHKDVPDEVILEMFAVMNEAFWFDFIILTKRSERLLEMNPRLNWTPNIWMGVSVENEEVLSRVEDLKKTDAKVKLLSCEPLLEPLSNLDVNGLDWIIVGGESKQRKEPRPMNVEWVKDLRDKCVAADVPFFFKQYGDIKNNPSRFDKTIKGGTKGGRTLAGKVWHQFPKDSAYNESITRWRHLKENKKSPIKTKKYSGNTRWRNVD